MTLTLEHDAEANAVYIRLSQAPIAQTRELDENRRVDYDAAGDIVGLEFLTVSDGVDLSNLPYRQELGRLFEDHHFPVFA